MSKAFASEMIVIFHDAEDFIRKIEEMGRMGYNHLAIADSSMAIAEGSLRPSNGTQSLTIWEDVLPHVR